MKVAIIAGCLVLLSAWSASAQTATPTATPSATPTPTFAAANVVTNQGISSPNQPCATSTVMQANTWYEVSAAVECQPCLEVTGAAPSYCPAPAATPIAGVCDPNAFWASLTHGHVGFGPPSSGTAATAVRVQVWDGNSSPIDGTETRTCDVSNGQVNCQYYDQQEDWVWNIPSSTHSVQVPYDFGTGSPAYAQVQGDGDPLRVYVFAMPIGGSLVCTSNQVVTEEPNGE
jgi:hypothetical protein